MPMNVLKQNFLVISLLFAVTCFTPQILFGDLTEDLTVNNNVAFDFGDYVLREPGFQGSYFFTNEGLGIEIPNTYLGTVALASSAVFDLEGLSSIEVTARVGASNNADLPLVIFNTFSDDAYIYEFPQNDFTVGEFVTVSLDADDFQLPFIDTGVLNGDIEFFGFTVPFSLNSSSLDYTVQTVTFVTSVPEPTTLSALLFACGLLGTQRKRSLNLGT